MVGCLGSRFYVFGFKFRKQVSETINLPLESIFRIAENQLKNYIEKLIKP